MICSLQGQRSAAADYRMINSLTIENFRCFERIRLTGLRRVNVLVGDSGSGKTALLEAIYLNLGVSPELALRIRAWRGLDLLPVTADRASYGALWNDLFYQFDTSREVMIAFDDSTAQRRALRIRYVEDDEVIFPFAGDTGQIGPTGASGPTGPTGATGASGSVSDLSISPVEFVYSYGERQFPVRPEFSSKGLRIPQADRPLLAGTFFATQSQFGREQYASFYSALSRQRREGEVVELMRNEFPDIESLSVEVSQGAPMIYADVRHLTEKVPVSLLSSGINKLLCLLLAIASQPKGVLVVDEIETGFYFARMESIWRMLLDFASRYEVQIVASTHSMECLVALSKACKKHPDDAMLIRTTMRDGTSTVEQFLGSSFFKGMKLGEVR